MRIAFPPLLSVALLSLALAAPVAAATAPRIPIASFEQLAKPLPLPYDEQANARAVVAAAKARARAHHKLLLIDLGGNWCLDCRLLAGTMDLPELRKFLASKYEIVTVDVGRFDKNLDIPAHYGITDRLEGVPAALIVDPRTDRLLNAGHVAALADARSMSPQALADWLASWTK
jgi:thiol-disulfide isomerase/thioredoxin